MAETSNVENLKSAYKAWEDTKGTDASAWMHLIDDDFHLRSMGQELPALQFASERKSRHEVLAYFSGITEHWEMVHWTPEEFITDGDQIAMCGRCAWINKATRKKVELLTAHFWKFKNGKAIELIELFDSAKAVAAATP